MDFSRLNQRRVILGGAASILLLVALFFLPWFTLSDVPQRETQNAWLCGEQQFECTGWETFPIMRWFLLAAAFAPAILGWILVRGHKLSWAPGELTMIVGFTAFILILYNGVIDKPGTGVAEVGVSLQIGYFTALLGSIGIAVTGYLRSQADQRKTRKAPGTV